MNRDMTVQKMMRWLSRLADVRAFPNPAARLRRILASPATVQKKPPRDDSSPTVDGDTPQATSAAWAHPSDLKPLTLSPPSPAPSAKRLINGHAFVGFADDDLGVWSRVADAELVHPTWGHGRVLTVEQRPGYIPLVRATFNGEAVLLNPDSFRLGTIRILVDDSLASRIDAWSADHATEEEDKRRDAEAREQIAREERSREQQRQLLVRRTAIRDRFSAFGISCLWHMTHKDNVASILEHGILSHYDAHGRQVTRVDISDPEAQKWRERMESRYRRRIHDYAPCYINPRNPMLYVRREVQRDLCLLEVSLDALEGGQYLLSDGNAASHDTLFFGSLDRLDALPWDVLRAGYWSDFPDGKRKRCAEVLIYPRVQPEHVTRVHCYSKHTATALGWCSREVVVTPRLFF